MKFVMNVLLAVLLTASKLIAASDTLSIDSYRIINTCSGEQRWVFAVWIGEVYFSDSLMSFDITIGYDTAHLRPTTGLWLGTLADKMRFSDISPYINLVVPGEIRVGAFTLTTPVKGNEPLFAVTGDYKGTCEDRDTFSLPYSPEFNEEFKVMIRYFRTDTVIAIAAATDALNQGALFLQDSVSLAGLDSTVTTNLALHLSETPADQYTVEVKLASPLIATIDSLTFSESLNIDSIVYSPDGLQAKAYTRSSGTDGEEGRIHLRSTTNDTASTLLIVETQALGECLCKTPGLRDTIGVYNVVQPVVSVETDIHDDVGIKVSHIDEGLLIQNRHGQPGTVNVVSVLGVTVSATAFSSGNTWLPLDSLPRGMYYAVVVASGRYQVTKFEL